MLKSFVKDSDLRKYHPNLNNFIWADASTYEDQIEEAFSRLYNDLHNININPRLLMLPLDLKASTQTHAFPLSTTITTSATGASKESIENLNRFVIDVTSLSGEWTICLQGSNDDSNWQEVEETYIMPELAQEYNVKFDNQYKHFRYSASGSGNIAFSAYLLEDIFDKCIIYKTFSMIFGDFKKTPGDRYDELKKEYDEAYKTFLNAIKFQYDSDDSGTVEEQEVVRQQNIYFVR